MADQNVVEALNRILFWLQILMIFATSSVVAGRSTAWGSGVLWS